MTDQSSHDNGRVSALVEIANDSMDRLEWAREQSRWRRALCKAIQVDLVTGDGELAKDLVSLTLHLEESHRDGRDDYIRQADQTLSAAGLRY